MIEIAVSFAPWINKFLLGILKLALFYLKVHLYILLSNLAVMVLQSASVTEPFCEATELPEPNAGLPDPSHSQSHSQHMPRNQDSRISKMPLEPSARFQDIPASSNID